MNQRRSDFELLRAFAREGNQTAFADLVRRHIDLVYGTVVRKLDDAGAAQEVSQNVFTALARKAWQFAPDDSLPAWLHRSALLESKAWLRGELRRRRREETAAQLGTTMNASDEQTALRAIAPLLDDALLELREKDRAALLLRFYEGRSLREVGAALGVSEDTAQKRVASAIEKLTQFFQRRGFRTATSAVAVAALKNLAVSASAATTSAVVKSALAAVPAVSGLGALASHLAGMTKMKTAVLCMALAAVPVAWKWTEKRAAENDLAQVQAGLAAATSEEDRLQAELERLLASNQRLEAERLQMAASKEQNEQARAKVDAWKNRLRSLLSADDYRWPDDLPFVRIPKAALEDIEVNMPVTPPGNISVPAREMLGLTVKERESLEGDLNDYFTGLDRMIDSQIYETNRWSRGWKPQNVTNIVFVVPGLGEEAKHASDNLLSAAKSILGPERWPMVESDTKAYGSHTLRRVLALDANQETQTFMVYLYSNAHGLSWAMYYGTERYSMGNPGSPLAYFLPEADPELAEWAYNNLDSDAFPVAVRQRIRTWLEQQARARLTPEEQR